MHEGRTVSEGTASGEDAQRQPMVPWDRIGREVRGIGLALLMVAATTLIGFGLQYLGVRRGSVIYLLPVLLAGWHLGRIPALVAAVTGLLWSGFLFYSSEYSFYIRRPIEMVNLALFMLVALVTSHLANSMKRQTELARRREREMGDLYSFSRRLTAAPSAAEIYRAIEDHLAALVQRRVVLVGAESGPGGKVDLAALPGRVRKAIASMQQGALSGTLLDDRTANTWMIRPVSPNTPDFGVIAIDLGHVSEDAGAELRQRIDDVLADAAATLERLDVARALGEAKMRSEAEQLREALIGSVSHELRTPLSSILGAATVLSNSPEIAEHERLKSLAGVIRDEAERLNSDIQNLLDATRITRQQVKPQQEWIEPADIINSALERRRRRLAGHEIRLDMDRNLPFIYVDPVLIEQALVQIVDNAAKYSPAGSAIAVAAKRNGQDMLLSVSDHGAGLTAEESARIGERFFRAPRHATATSGSGLGLWIAKAFVAANGGRIEAASAGTNQGSTITIHLPLRADAPQPEAVLDE
jgi:two-component system, OmpR family, sensor histidine kinase KdpD